jgi:hypothetical protein
MPDHSRPTRYLDLTEISLSPGPRQLHEPAFSFDTHSIVLHPPEAIAEAFLSVPGTRLLHPAKSSWDAWKARWEEGERSIDLDINALEVDAEDGGGLSLAWENSSLHTHCLLADLMLFWESVLAQCPGAWLQDTDCRLWSPSSFSNAVLDFHAGTERATWRPGWGMV